MASSLTLKELIGALTGAVADAQDSIQRHQLGIIGDYFDALGRPHCYRLMLPHTSRTAAEDDHRTVAVPLLSVVEPNLLAISEFRVDFDVELGSLAGDEAPDGPPGVPDSAAAPAAAPVPQRFGAPVDVPNVGPGAAAASAAAAASGAATASAAPAAAPGAAADLLQPMRAPAPPAMSVGLATGSSASAPLAKLSIKVVSRPVSDGMARMIDALNKTI